MFLDEFFFCNLDESVPNLHHTDQKLMGLRKEECAE